MAGSVKYGDPEWVAERDRIAAAWQAKLDAKRVENEKAGPLDKLGNTLQLNDVVAYGANAGRSAGRLRISWVKKIEFKALYGQGAWRALVTRPECDGAPRMVSSWQQVNDTLKLPFLNKEDVKSDDTRYY